MSRSVLKRNFECDSIEISGCKTGKRRRYSPTKYSDEIYDSAGKYSSLSNNMTLKPSSKKTNFDLGGKSKEQQRALQLRQNGFGNTARSSSSGCDKIFFTVEDVRLICENIVKEKENEIRKEYDRILNTKLAEQYDKFVKFTQAEIEKRFKSRTPSYLS